MIIQYKPDEDQPEDWYWACEYCGASNDDKAPAGTMGHRPDCPDSTWNRKEE